MNLVFVCVLEWGQERGKTLTTKRRGCLSGTPTEPLKLKLEMVMWQRSGGGGRDSPATKSPKPMVEMVMKE